MWSDIMQQNANRKKKKIKKGGVDINTINVYTIAFSLNDLTTNGSVRH